MNLRSQTITKEDVKDLMKSIKQSQKTILKHFMENRGTKYRVRVVPSKKIKKPRDQFLEDDDGA